LYKPLSGTLPILPNLIDRIPGTRTSVQRASALVFFLIALCCLSLPSYAQKAHTPKAKPLTATEKPDEKSTVEPGVVVEEVEAGREGDKAGLKVGDVILGWSRGDASGKIESPFDYMWVDIEQRPRSEVALDGIRGDKKATWTLGRGEWGIRTRPNFSGHLLRVYRRSWARGMAGHAMDGARSWFKEESPTWTKPAWLPSWSAFYEAQLYRWGNDEVSGEKAYRLAVRRSEHLDSIARSRIVNSWGGLYCAMDKLPRAEKLFRESSALLREDQQSSLLKAYYLNDQARTLVSLGKNEAAAPVYEEVLKIRESLAPNSAELAETLAGIGTLQSTVGDYDNASKSFERALAIQHQIAPGSFEEAAYLAYLGWFATTAGNLEQSEDFNRRSLVMYSKVAPHSANLVEVLNSLAIVSLHRGDLAGAAAFIRRAINLKIKLASSVDATDLTINLGMLAKIEFDMGNVAASRSLLRHADRMIPKITEKGQRYLMLFDDLGDAARHIGLQSQAEAYLKKSVELSKEQHEHGYSKCWALLQLGGIYFDRGNLVKAEQYYEQALTLSQTVFPGSADQAEIYAGLARIARLNNRLFDAVRYYSDSLAAIETQAAHLGGYSRFQAAYHANHLKYYREYIDLLVQQHWSIEAFDLLERSRARTLLETLAMAAVNIHQGADGKLLSQKMSLSAAIKSRSDHRLSLLTQKHSAEQLKGLEAEIAELTQQYEEVEEKLKKTSPDYAALTQPKPLILEEIEKELLDKDTALVEYSLAEKRSYAFVVTPDSLVVRELPKRSEIEKAARNLHRLLKNSSDIRQPGTTVSSRPVQYQAVAVKNLRRKMSGAEAIQRETQRTAALLSRMVLDPIAGDIGNKRLLIVADGALHYIPFTALPEPLHGAAQQKTSQAAPPLMVNHEVILLPSASVLAVLRKQQERKAAPTAEVAVLADPVFDKADARVLEARHSSPHTGTLAKNARLPVESAKSMYDLATPPLTRSLVDVGLGRGAAYHLPRLRYTRREAEAIYAQVPQGSAMKALDFDANRATATSSDLSRYRIVHFATHGLLNSEHPELSGLVLSLVDRDGRPQDGFLGLQDIYNLNLSADLVVLSACETGLGKEISGEGLVGLTRGFMYAGATRVVASLWKVSDAATATLMAEFYRAMEQDHLAPAAALRQAQISMWKQKRWSDPYYWAAFQIQGEWK
jgi:CHAT domain-containing protein